MRENKVLPQYPNDTRVLEIVHDSVTLQARIIGTKLLGHHQHLPEDEVLELLEERGKVLYLAEQQFPVLCGLTDEEQEDIKYCRYTGGNEAREKCEICEELLKRNNVVVTLSCGNLVHRSCFIEYSEMYIECPTCDELFCPGLEKKRQL